jgi:hypothetical protein
MLWQFLLLQILVIALAQSSNNESSPAEPVYWSYHVENAEPADEVTVNAESTTYTRRVSFDDLSEEQQREILENRAATTLEEIVVPQNISVSNECPSENDNNNQTISLLENQLQNITQGYDLLQNKFIQLESLYNLQAQSLQQFQDTNDFLTRNFSILEVQTKAKVNQLHIANLLLENQKLKFEELNYELEEKVLNYQKETMKLNALLKENQKKCLSMMKQSDCSQYCSQYPAGTIGRSSGSSLFPSSSSSVSSSSSSNDSIVASSLNRRDITIEEIAFTFYERMIHWWKSCKNYFLRDREYQEPPEEVPHPPVLQEISQMNSDSSPIVSTSESSPVAPPLSSSSSSSSSSSDRLSAVPTPALSFTMLSVPLIFIKLLIYEYSLLFNFLFHKLPHYLPKEIILLFSLFYHLFKIPSVVSWIQSSFDQLLDNEVTADILNELYFRWYKFLSFVIESYEGNGSIGGESAGSLVWDSYLYYYDWLNDDYIRKLVNFLQNASVLPSEMANLMNEYLLGVLLTVCGLALLWYVRKMIMGIILLFFILLFLPIFIVGFAITKMIYLVFWIVERVLGLFASFFSFFSFSSEKSKNNKKKTTMATKKVVGVTQKKRNQQQTTNNNNTNYALPSRDQSNLTNQYQQVDDGIYIRRKSAPGTGGSAMVYGLEQAENLI